MDRNVEEENVILWALEPPENLATSSSSGSSSSSSSDNGSGSSSDNSDSSDDADVSMESSSEFNAESDDDEDVHLFAAYNELLFGAPRARVENFVEVAREKSEAEFREGFRLHRNVAYDMIDDLDRSGYIPDHPDGKEKKTAELSFLLFLSMVASDSVHRDVANLFGCGTTTVFRVVRRVTDWIFSIRNDHITWPRGRNIAQITRAFASRADIQNFIVAIDGSHIFIERPMRYGRAYYCRKDRYSIVLQAVSDFNMLFTNVHCGDPGSYHDTAVLRRSQLFRLAEDHPEEVFPNGTFLLGDKGYQGVGKKWIVHAFKDYNNLTVLMSEFNDRISATRVVVETAFGILRARFRYLRGTLRLRDVNFAARLVVACCVLHNICIRSGDFAEDLIPPAEHVAREGVANVDGEGVANVGGQDDNGNGTAGEDDSDSDDEDVDANLADEVPLALRGTRIAALFRAMYPGAVIAPPNRRRRGAADEEDE